MACLRSLQLDETFTQKFWTARVLLFVLALGRSIRRHSRMHESIIVTT